MQVRRSDCDVNVPLLLVASLMTEELREVECSALVVAVLSDRFFLLWVAVRLHSAGKRIRTDLIRNSEHLDVNVTSTNFRIIMDLFALITFLCLTSYAKLSLLQHFVMRTQHLTVEKTHLRREHTPHFSFKCMFASSNTTVYKYSV